MLLTKLKAFFRSEEAATTVEYAFLITLIVIALSQTIRLVGTNAGEVFTKVGSVLPQ